MAMAGWILAYFAMEPPVAAEATGFPWLALPIEVLAAIEVEARRLTDDPMGSAVGVAGEDISGIFVGKRCQGWCMERLNEFVIQTL